MQIVNPVLVYTVHKAGSMFLHKLLADIAARLRVAHLSINNEELAPRILEEGWQGVIEEKPELAICGPIRAGEALPQVPPRMEDFRPVLCLRDPRDVLTSMYFSWLYSHREADGSYSIKADHRAKWEREGIDAFVLAHVPQVRRGLELLDREILEHVDCPVLRYRDMVTNFPDWLAQLLEQFQDYPIPPKRRMKVIYLPNSLEKIHKELCEKYAQEFVTEQEDVSRHKRQIQPGDHARKLQPETIEKLNEEFEPWLMRYWQSELEQSTLHS